MKLLLLLGAAIAAVLFAKKSNNTVQQTGKPNPGCIPTNSPRLVCAGDNCPPATSLNLQTCSGDEARNLTSGPMLDRILANNGLIWNADQKEYQVQPDLTNCDKDCLIVKPLPAWNPTNFPDLKVIGNPGGSQGGPASQTLPNAKPGSYLDLNPVLVTAGTGDGVTGNSPTFWAADIVPSNPLLRNKMTGPNLTR